MYKKYKQIYCFLPTVAVDKLEVHAWLGSNVIYLLLREVGTEGRYGLARGRNFELLYSLPALLFSMFTLF